ncbi:MAG: helix-turn-helix domain-containing protein [Chloroflexota bacterium]|nr:helix-turn-helix domain-containing protein [Chloroflexota bacterium]
MGAQDWKQLRWIADRRVPVPPAAGRASADAAPTPRERLVAALADRPRTVAQLAQTFGLSQPTMLEHVRRALRAGLIVEVAVAEGERRFAAERYYATAVPVIRQPDQEVLQSACRALAGEIGRVLSRSQGDLRSAFAMTALARDGWTFDDLWPYLHETIGRLALQQAADLPQPVAPRRHGLAWVEDLAEFAAMPGDAGTERKEESA